MAFDKDVFTQIRSTLGSFPFKNPLRFERLSKLLSDLMPSLTLSIGTLTVSGTATLNGNVVLGSDATDTVTINGTVVNFSGANALVFEGSGADDAFEITLAVANPAADRVYTITDVGANANFVMTEGAQTINGAKLFDNTGLRIEDSDASHGLIFTTGSNLTANRNFTINPGDAARILTMSGDAALNQDVLTTSNPTFVNLTITSFAANWTNAGRTVADLGIVTTVDINGGTIDGVAIGAAAAGAATFSTLSVQADDIIMDSDDAGGFTTTLRQAATAARIVTVPDFTGTLYISTGTDVALADGGTNASLVASNGGIFYSTAAAGAILAGTATAGQLLQSGATAAPTWSTSTYPATNVINTLLYASAANVMAALATANSGVLVTGATGIPSISTDIPTAVTIGAAYIYRVSGTDVAVADGGTGLSATTINQILYSSAANTIAELATANSGVLVTGATGIPSIATDIPTAVTIGGAYISRVGGTDVTLADGGTSASLVASNGAMVYSTAAAIALSAVGASGQLLTSAGAAAPVWTTSTYPATNAINTLLYASAANTMTALATGNDGVLITSGAGVPSISSTIPSATQDNITRIGTLVAGAVPASLVTAATFAAGATYSFEGSTITNAGTVTTIDLNGGTIDGTNIGAAVVGTGAFSTVAGTTLIGSVGIQATSTAATATADGLTTGLIPSNTSVVVAANGGDVNNIITLPAPVAGMKIHIYPSAGLEVRTVAASNVTINNVDSDGTNELALIGGNTYRFECISATAWIAIGWTNLGAALAALVPDAA